MEKDDQKARGESGRYTPETPDTAILAAVRTHEPASTRDVADEVGMTRQGADRRLRKLRDDARVNSKKVGPALIWFTPDDVAEETPESGPGDVPESDTLDDVDAHSGDDSAALDDVDFPGTKDRAECEAVVLEARDYLRENGGATMREIVSTVMPEHPLDYEVPDLDAGGRYRGAWWRRVVKPGLEALPDVEKPKAGGSEWRVVDREDGR